MSIYHLLEYSGKYAKRSASLCQYYRYEPNDNITDSKSFNFKSNITDNSKNAGIANVKIVITLKYFSNFWRTLEMPLINGEVNLDLNWSDNCVICEANRATTFAMTSAELYVPIATLSTQDNAKLLQQLKLRFKRTISWNKYQSKKSTEAQIRYLDILISPSFQIVNNFLYCLFTNEDGRL